MKGIKLSNNMEDFTKILVEHYTKGSASARLLYLLKASRIHTETMVWYANHPEIAATSTDEEKRKVATGRFAEDLRDNLFLSIYINHLALIVGNDSFTISVMTFVLEKLIDYNEFAKVVMVDYYESLDSFERKN